ncbi:MAG: V-type ATP synthase subunit I [Actinobacteria bacterium]|nr:V-type ATP synthase subunit I [Actinomycetota bacterium]
MAIEPVKRITIIAHRSLQDEVVGALQSVGTVHLSPFDGGDEISQKELSEDEAAAVRQYTLNISKVDFLLDLFKQYEREKRGFVRTIIRDKYPLTEEEFLRAEQRVDLERVYSECFDLEGRLLGLRERQSRLEDEARELRVWAGVDIPLEEIKAGRSFDVTTARIMKTDLEDLSSLLSQNAPLSGIEVIGEKGEWLMCLVIFHREARELVMEALSGYKHELVSVPATEGTTGERLDSVMKELELVRREFELLVRELERYREHVPSLEIVREFYENQARRVQSMTSFGVTDSAVAVQGWITEDGFERTGTRLQDISDEMSVEVSDPTEEDSTPVSLKNSRFARPFELITKLYGVPRNGEYDPTWIIAISFMVFFGFCIGDVGYGVVLTAAFLLMHKYLPVGRRVKDLFVMMMYGSAFAVVVGVLTGSWFGIETAKLPSFLRSLAVFDPLKDPLPVMGVCMGLGVVHMLGGTMVEFRDNWRDGRRADALIDQGLVLLLFLGTGLAGVLALLGLIPISSIYAVPAVSVFGMIVLMGHGNRSVPGKIFGGLYETYNTLVGWMGDVVSYTRLFALGLATFVIGWVVNTLSGMVMGLAPVIGILLMLVLLLVGHTFNILINLLGAFVHPLRLEFVEFFSKFYEDGGREFRPLKIESKVVIIK